MTLRGPSEDLLLKKVSRTLYLSFAILPKEIKKRLSLGYLICRAMDSAVDSSALDNSNKKEILKSFSEMIFSDPEKLCSQLRAFSSSLPDKWERELLYNFQLAADGVSSLSDNEKKNLNTLIKGVAKGMETDLDFFNSSEPKALPCKKDLIFYCRQIGGVPGIYWHEAYNSWLSGRLGDKEIKKAAYNIGEALQLTNIIKDIKEDLLKGRCYFPNEQLEEKGLSAEDLLKKEKFPAFRPILSHWILRAVDLLDSSEVFLLALGKSHFSLRAAVIWPIYWAMDTLHEAAISNPLACKIKIGRGKIYSAVLNTPSLLLSDSVFQRGYRFRREAVITAISGNL